MNMKQPSDETEMPFSPRLLELVSQFLNASREKRADLAPKIAATMASEHDSTDFEATDDYHVFFEDYQAARLEYEQQAVKLARMTVHLVTVYMANNDLDFKDVIPPVVQTN